MRKQIDDLNRFVQTYLGRPYKKNLLGRLKAAYDAIGRIKKEKARSIFSSELIATSYK